MSNVYVFHTASERMTSEVFNAFGSFLTATAGSSFLVEAFNAAHMGPANQTPQRIIVLGTLAALGYALTKAAPALLTKPAPGRKLPIVNPPKGPDDSNRMPVAV